jgi:hypothetical protein
MSGGVGLALLAACASASQTTPFAGDPDDNAHCPKGLKIPPLSTTVVLSANGSIPAVGLQVGQAFRAVAKSADANVLLPEAANTKIVCQATATPPGRERSVTFVAIDVGTTVIDSTVTGVPGGINHPAYMVRVTVTAHP